MKKHLHILTLFLIPFCSKGQDIQLPGWYVLEKGSQVGVYALGASELAKAAVQNPQGIPKTEFNAIRNNIVFGRGEIVMIFQKLDEETYLAYDPVPRVVLVKGPVTPVISKNGQTGYVKADYTSMNGGRVKAGMYVYILSQNTSSKTYTIQAENGKTLDVPEDKMTFFRESFNETNEQNPVVLIPVK